MTEAKRKSLSATLVGILLLFFLFPLSGCRDPDGDFNPEGDPPMTGLEAKQMLIEGNGRYVAGKVLRRDLGPKVREELVKGQKPLAVIVGCSDSRVPPELIFDQGLGKLFVVRTAGNVIDEGNLGTVEYGVEHLGASLVVVLGHSLCGAVEAAAHEGEEYGHLEANLEKIRPAVAQAMGITHGNLEEAKKLAVDLNIRNSVFQLKKSDILRHEIQQGNVTILGARYDLHTGQVHWLE